jgi:carboxymethylenebutenolidase
VQIHVAEQDDYFTPDAAMALRAQLEELGTDVDVHVYPGAGHAFFNEDRPEVHHAESADKLWERSVAFFKRTLA